MSEFHLSIKKRLQNIRQELASINCSYEKENDYEEDIRSRKYPKKRGKKKKKR